MFKFIIKTIFFVISISVLPLTLAAETTSIENKKKLEDKKWIIQSISKDEKETYKQLHLGFIKFLNGSIEGQSTCNIYDGVYSLGKDQTIHFFRIGITQVICNVGNKMAIEQTYTEGLEQVKTYKFEGEQLVLYKEGNKEFARFSAK
ncbi:MAG: META domain-containing protein [Rhodomicrobiaceae bacterium]